MSVESSAEGQGREERLAQNEVLFRSLNEQIEQKAIELGGVDGYEFVCECSSDACFDRIKLTFAEYEYVRREGTRFFVMPGHQDIEVELVVESTPAFMIVEKDGVAGLLADLANPRDDDPSYQ
jgi:hypothetical protein